MQTVYLRNTSDNGGLGSSMAQEKKASLVFLCADLSIFPSLFFPGKRESHIPVSEDFTIAFNKDSLLLFCLSSPYYIQEKLTVFCVFYIS